MEAKRLVTGAVVGGAVMFVVGYLFWTVLFADFFASHVGSAAGVDREAPIWWASALGTLLLATLVTLVIHWSGTTSMADGFKMGALVGVLVWGGVDFIFYGHLNLNDLTATIADPALELLRTGLGGLAVAAVIGQAGATAAVTDQERASEAAPVTE
jgi:hypothetical protein